MQGMTVDVLMVDGTEHKDVQIILADQVGFSQTRHRHKWPSMEQDQLLAVNFMAFLAMKRQGLFEGNWDAFTEQTALVFMEDGEEIDPT